MMANTRQRLALDNFVATLPLILPLIIRYQFKDSRWQPIIVAYQNLSDQWFGELPKNERVDEKWLQAVQFVNAKWALLAEELVVGDVETKREVLENHQFVGLSAANIASMRKQFGVRLEIEHPIASILLIARYFPTLSTYGLERTALSILIKEPVAECHDIFLTVSRQNEKWEEIQIICLQGMQSFNTSEIEQYLIDRYFATPNFDLTPKLQEELWSIAQQYSGNIFTEYLLLHIRDDQIKFFDRTIRVLRLRGVGEERIYRRIYTVFQTSNSVAYIEEVLDVLTLFKSNKLPLLLDEIIDKIELEQLRINIRPYYSVLPPTILQRLVNLSYDKNQNTRRLAIEQLLAFEGTKYMRHLLERYYNEEVSTQLIILQSLISIDNGLLDHQLLDFLLNAKEKGNTIARQYCMKHIRKIAEDKTVRPKLYPYLITDVQRNDIEEEAKSHILYMLRWYKKPEALEVLGDFSNHSDDRLSKIARESLSIIRRKESNRQRAIVQRTKQNQTINTGDDDTNWLIWFFMMVWVLSMLWSVYGR